MAVAPPSGGFNFVLTSVAMQKSLVPHPFLSEKFEGADMASRSVMRRRIRKAKTVSWINDGILALNELAGKGQQKHIGAVGVHGRAALDNI